MAAAALCFSRCFCICLGFDFSIKCAESQAVAGKRRRQLQKQRQGRRAGETAAGCRGSRVGCGQRQFERLRGGHQHFVHEQVGQPLARARSSASKLSFVSGENVAGCADGFPPAALPPTLSRLAAAFPTAAKHPARSRGSGECESSRMQRRIKCARDSLAPKVTHHRVRCA